MTKISLEEQIDLVEVIVEAFSEDSKVLLNNSLHGDRMRAIKKSLQKLQKKKPPKTEAEEEPGRKLQYWGEFVGAYTKMYTSETPLTMALSPAEWKCLKRIIERFVDSVPDQDEAEALHAWELLMSNWSQLNTFLRGQFKPFSLEKYLDEIAQKFRNGTAKNTAESAKDSRDQLRRHLAERRQQGSS